VIFLLKHNKYTFFTQKHKKRNYFKSEGTKKPPLSEWLSMPTGYAVYGTRVVSIAAGNPVQSGRCLFISLC